MEHEGADQHAPCLVERKTMMRFISLSIAAGLLLTAAVIAACNTGSALYISGV
jgi:hypothetical protein